MIFIVLGVIITSILIQGFTTFNPAWICCYVIGYTLGMNENGKYINEKVLMVITGIIAIAGNALQIYCDYVANIDFTGFGIIKNYNHVMLGVFIFLLLKMIFEKADLNTIGKMLKFSDAYSFEVYLVHQLLILGPFSLLALMGYPLVNILITLLGVCVLVFVLKKADNIVEGIIGL